VINVTELTDKKQTGAEMYKLVERFSGDIDYFRINGIPLSEIPFPQFFDTIKKIPFKKDPSGTEIVTRPFHLLAQPWHGWDCKKKAIVIASWLHENCIPFRFMAVSRRPDGVIHHVIVEATPSIENDPLEIDATYPENDLYIPGEWTAKEHLPNVQNYESLSGQKLVSMYGYGVPTEPGIKEFHKIARTVSAEEMGSPTVGAIIAIVGGIVSAVGAVTATVINAVASKRRQEREQEFAVKMYQEQQKQFINPEPQQTNTGTAPDYSQWIIPALGALGLIAIL